MFSKIFAIIILIVIVYWVSIFVFPELSDTYWHKNLNTKIRDIKNKSLQFASGSDSAWSLMDKVIDLSLWATSDLGGIIASWSQMKDTLIDTSKQFVEEWKQTIENTEQVITEKTEQAKKAAESAKKAYEAVDQAKKDFQNFTNFSGAANSSTGQ